MQLKKNTMLFAPGERHLSRLGPKKIIFIHFLCQLGANSVAAPDSALLEPEVLVLLPCLGLGVAAGVYLRRRVRPSADSL